ncbi:MAG: chorismate synthase [Oscillospiraceae bacterium]|nr:chorismate synthase [Oscillospiraceae bacterium]
MSNSVGSIFRFTIFGQSHGPAIGVTMEGLPSGFAIDMDALETFLARRAPGQNDLSTPRKEADKPVFLSGLKGNVTCGAPVTAVIFNENTRSSDYDALRTVPRPGHADFAAMQKFGDARDDAGGGQFSGRLTAPLCIAGGICLQLLEKKGIHIRAEAGRIGGESDPKKFAEVIRAAAKDGDSVGGVISCRADGVPAGIGEPMFDGLENRIAQVVFGIPAVKGIEFGAGFSASDLRGSENNDAFRIRDGAVITETNNHGGILGGISSGMPICFRVAVKPTPSIAKVQKSVDIAARKETDLSVKGRHDPCIVLRALPCVEAAAAVALYDEMRLGGLSWI